MPMASFLTRPFHRYGSSCRAWPRISRSGVRSSRPPCPGPSARCANGRPTSPLAWKPRRMPHPGWLRMLSRSWPRSRNRLLRSRPTVPCYEARCWHGGTNSWELVNSCGPWRRRSRGSETASSGHSREHRRRSRRSVSRWNLAWKTSSSRKPKLGVSESRPCGKLTRPAAVSWNGRTRIWPARRRVLRNPSLAW